MIVQAAVKVGTMGAHTLLRVIGGAGTVAELRCTQAGEFVAYDADGAVLDTTARGTLRAGRWHYLELKLQQAASGRLRVRVDGSTLIDESGADLVGTSTAVSSVQLGGAAGGVYWSDLLVMDGSGARCSDMLGPRTRVALLRPLANGAEADWTASPTTGGATAALDDDIPGASDGADTYITTSTVTHKSTVTCEPLGPEAENIEAAAVLLEAEATTQGVQAIGISGSTQSAGATASLNAVGAGYRVARHTMHGNPATGGRWTRASVSALRVGGLAV